MRRSDSHNSGLKYYSCLIKSGQVAFSREPALISTICGNGLIISVRDKWRCVGGLANCVYPKHMAKQGKCSNYYVDVAMRSLLRSFQAVRSAPASLEVQLIGGGSFDSAGAKRARDMLQIARKICRRLSLKIISEDVGGELGRKVVFNTFSGEMMIMKTKKVRRTDWLPGTARLPFTRS